MSPDRKPKTSSVEILPPPDKMAESLHFPISRQTLGELITDHVKCQKEPTTSFCKFFISSDCSLEVCSACNSLLMHELVHVIFRPQTLLNQTLKHT